MVVVVVIFLPITTVLVTIWMVWYTGDCRRGVTPSLAITVLAERKPVISVNFFLPVRLPSEQNMHPTCCCQ